MSLRIVSLNAWGGAVWDTLSAWVARAEFDVLCLQEVTRRIAPSEDWLIYRDAYRNLDQRADLFGDVSALLPGWQAVFAPAARGPLYNADGRAIASEHGIGCWVTPGRAVTARSQGFAYGGYRANGWGDEPVPRAIQSLRVVCDRLPVSVTHLHGLRAASGKGDTPERHVQALAVRAHLEAFRASSDVAVLAGDLNLLPQSGFFDVMRDIGMTDLVTSRGVSDTRTHLYPKSQRHANYCLVSDPGRVAGFSAPAEPVLSDHRPLILDLAV